MDNFKNKAALIREATKYDTETTLRKVTKILASANIPHLVCGGFAVQEHGYPRFTIDVDVIVPDVKLAMESLALRGFKQNYGSNMTVTDRETKVEVDLLPGGGSVGPGPISLPLPIKVESEPQILSLEFLISLKLSSYIGNKMSRAKDLADVVELIKANHSPIDLDVDKKVKKEYMKIWKALQ